MAGYLENLEVGELTVGKILGGGLYNIPGNVYYLDPTNGSDGNSGKRPNEAKETLAAGYALLTTGQHDTLVYIPGTTALEVASGGLTWAHSYTHFVSLGAFVGTGQRSRIFAASANTDASMVTVSGSGCLFKGLRFHYGVASAAAKYCVTVTGGRNRFDECAIEGIGNVTQDVTGAASLFMNGAEENKFVDSQIGLNTIGRGTAVNTTVLYDGAAQRNQFENCLFSALLEADTHTFLEFADTTSHNSYELFKRCTFIAESVNMAIAMATAFTIPSSHQTTCVVLDHCGGVNITDWEVENRSNVWCIGPDHGTAGTGCGIGVVVA